MCITLKKYPSFLKSKERSEDSYVGFADFPSLASVLLACLSES